MIQKVKDNYYDGITFDYESPIKWNSADKNRYTLIVNETV